MLIIPINMWLKKVYIRLKREFSKNPVFMRFVATSIYHGVINLFIIV